MAVLGPVRPGLHARDDVMVAADGRALAAGRGLARAAVRAKVRRDIADRGLGALLGRAAETVMPAPSRAVRYQVSDLAGDLLGDA